MEVTHESAYARATADRDVIRELHLFRIIQDLDLSHLSYGWHPFALKAVLKLQKIAGAAHFSVRS